MRFPFFIFLFALLTVGSRAQQSQEPKSPYVKLGEKALLDGDFKLAVSHLEKALPTDSNRFEVMYMLGYSYYHSANYQKAVSSFTRAVSLKPLDVSAYYYRGKARNILGTQTTGNMSLPEREKLLQASVKDFTKAIELNSNDIKLYQNRALAYRDLGILKSQKMPRFYDKEAAATAYKACLADFQRVLDVNPTRPDILLEVKKAKVYLANLDN